MEKRIYRFELHEIKQWYEEDNNRLKHYDYMRSEIKKQLDRNRVLELLGLKNNREELEKLLNEVEEKMIFLTERKSQYDQIFL